MTDRYIIFADAVGLRSKEAVIFLKGKGYDKIANMAGGIVDWERDGLPIATDIRNRLSGSCMCQLKPREKGRSSFAKATDFVRRSGLRPSKAEDKGGGEGEIGRKR